MPTLRASFLFLSLLLLNACGPAAVDTDAGPPPGEPDAGADAGFDRVTAPILPTASGTCPDFLAGETVTVEPAGVAPRDVRVWISDAAETLDGPLVFFWHGAGGRPTDAQYGLGAPMIEALLERGGVVVSASHDPAAGDFPWYLTVGSGEDDLLVTDEVVACLHEQVGVDPMHIHSVGFSAGALHNSQLALRRASYIASAAMFSGGMITRRRPPTDAPNARLAVLLYHGGPGDVVVTNFMDATETYRGVLSASGHFSVLCDHGGGHTIPSHGPDQVLRFFDDHPYGVAFPWADGLPEVFGPECTGSP